MQLFAEKKMGGSRPFILDETIVRAALRLALGASLVSRSRKGLSRQAPFIYRITGSCPAFSTLPAHCSSCLLKPLFPPLSPVTLSRHSLFLSSPTTEEGAEALEIPDRESLWTLSPANGLPPWPFVSAPLESSGTSNVDFETQDTESDADPSWSRENKEGGEKEEEQEGGAGEKEEGEVVENKEGEKKKKKDSSTIDKECDSDANSPVLKKRRAVQRWASEPEQPPAAQGARTRRQVIGLGQSGSGSEATSLATKKPEHTQERVPKKPIVKKKQLKKRKKQKENEKKQINPAAKRGVNKAEQVEEQQMQPGIFFLTYLHIHFASLARLSSLLSVI